MTGSWTITISCIGAAVCFDVRGSDTRVDFRTRRRTALCSSVNLPSCRQVRPEVYLSLTITINIYCCCCCCCCRCLVRIHRVYPRTEIIPMTRVGFNDFKDYRLSINFVAKFLETERASSGTCTTVRPTQVRMQSSEVSEGRHYTT